MLVALPPPVPGRPLRFGACAERLVFTASQLNMPTREGGACVVDLSVL